MLKYKNFWGRFRSRLDCRCTMADVLNFGMVSLRPLQVDHVFGFRQLGCLAGMRQPDSTDPVPASPSLKILFTEAPAEMHRESNIGLKYIYKGANTKPTQISFKYRHGKQGVFNHKKSLAPRLKCPTSPTLGHFHETFHNDF